MNEFQLYEILCTTESVAAQYPAGEEIRARIGQAKEAVSTRRYRIAVVGEFKKGKSSLINALVGSNLLPTDVLPTTAVVNRIVFGESRKIAIHYKNGTVEQKTVDDLEQYATKLDAQKEERSAQIREIVIEYPSVFCQNRIEIIDTPGLNDNEQMSEVTWGILDEIDTALVTISAGMPLSMTERDLILELIGRVGIRHITFVITFIDQISNRKSEQDKMVEFIRKRLQKEVLDYAREYFDGQPELVQKSVSLLEEPIVFAVSSVLAMKGFAYDDAKILQESRFPQFKQSLFDLLIANQSADMYAKTKEQVQEVSRQLGGWDQLLQQQLKEQHRTAQITWEEQRNYICKSGVWLQKQMVEMEQRLENKGFDSGQGLCRELSNQLCYGLKQYFVRSLSTIRSDDMSEAAIRNCLSCGAKEAMEWMQKRCLSFDEWIQQEMSPLYQQFCSWRLTCGCKSGDFDERIRLWRQQNLFPHFAWHRDILLCGIALMEANPIVLVENVIAESLGQLGAGIARYLASWRILFFQQNDQDIKEMQQQEEPEDLAVQLELCKRKYVSNCKLLAECEQSLKKGDLQ